MYMSFAYYYFRVKKVSIFKAQPFQPLLVMDFPPSRTGEWYKVYYFVPLPSLMGANPLQGPLEGLSSEN
jgi:hypothetical protein